MSDKGEIAPPQATACPRCNSERVLAEAVNTVRVTKVDTKLPGITGGFSEMWALVCTNCGYTELYAKKPRVVA